VRGKQGYHHGDLRNALLGAALELIGEQGPRAFSLAEAARRAGVSVAAPYRHFPDKDALLAAIATEGYALLEQGLREGLAQAPAAPVLGLRALAEAYVRFSTARKAHFRAMFSGGLVKAQHPGLARAAERAFRILLDVVARLRETEGTAAIEQSALAIWAIAHGAAVLHGEGDLGAQVSAAAALAANTVAAYAAGRGSA
jgi:AcrR family transcriptional regulator